MKRTHLGQFEEMIMLLIAALEEEAYGLQIKRALKKEMGRDVTLSRVHVVCNRLELLGFLSAKFGERSSRRGGRRKKTYRVSLKGAKALSTIAEPTKKRDSDPTEVRNLIWPMIPGGTFQNSTR